MNRESSIDKKYREQILRKYFNNPVLKGTSQCPKWVLPCPFCSSGRKSESKRNEKVAALLWNETHKSWVFTCRRKACLHRTLSFPKLMERLDAQLFLEYQQERFHAGSTGFQTNCPHPAAITALKSSRPFPRSSGKSSGSDGSSKAIGSRSLTDLFKTAYEGCNKTIIIPNQKGHKDVGKPANCKANSQNQHNLTTAARGKGCSEAA